MPQNTLDLLLTKVAEALGALSSSVATAYRAQQLVNALGWDLPPGVTDIGLTGLNVSNVADKLMIVLHSTPAEQKDDGVMFQRYADLLIAVKGLISNLQQTAQALATSPAIPSNYLNATKIDQELPKRLLDLLIIKYVEHEHPLLDALLTTAGIFEREYFSANSPLYQVEHVRHTVVFDNVGALLAPEKLLLREVYGWGTSVFDVERFLLHLGLILQSVGGVVRLRGQPRRVEEKLLGTTVSPTADPNLQLLITLVRGIGWNPMEVGLTLFGLRPTTSGGSDGGFGLAPFARGTQELIFPLSADGESIFEIDTSLNLKGGVVLIFRPGQDISVQTNFIGGGNAGTLASGRVGLRLRRSAAGGAATRLLSIHGGSLVKAQQLYLGGGVERQADGSFDGFVELGMVGGTIALTVAEMDNFITKLLPAEGLKAEFDFRAGWSNSRGVYFQGSGGLETTIAIHKTLGPFNLETLYLVLAAKPEGLQLGASISGGAMLGPLALSVERIGLITDLKFQLGNLGPVDLTIAFKPPNGLGLVLAAGPVTGGGFLSIDTANGRYAGVLQLSIADKIAITAIGLLDTKLPGGKKGFSFLIIITAKFPPIQLGFGFALTGLGGLAGIHRSIVAQALQDGVRNRSLGHILFPEDPVKNAPKLISDLQAIFPPTEGQYVFGPMASLVWGTPTVIEAELGIILQLPDPIRLIILGQVNVLLPDKKAAVIELHLDIVGIIDFTNKNLSLDASLHDSRLAVYNLYGDMAMRLSWGAPPNFALSVGGLHPQFQPPPNFPTLQRLTVALGLGENPRFSLQAYLAVTSNTVQFGALAELYAEAAGFNVYGWIGFDVLFIFTPFSLTADFSAGVALRKGSTLIASVHLAATLTGPTPWHAWGEASISILLVSITVSFDATFGEEQHIELPPADPWAALEAEIKKTGNWSATLPPASSQVVSLVAPAKDEPGLALIDPLGGLTLRQKVVPFDRTLTKFGQGPLAPEQRFTVAGVRVGAQPATTGSALLDYFAPGQFQEMTDAEKLSRPSFEQMQAGTTIASDAVAFGAVKGTDYTYKTVIVDAPDKPKPSRPDPPAYKLRLNHQTAALQRSAAALSPLRTTGLDKFAPPPSEPALVMMGEEEYIIVNATSLADQMGKIEQEGIIIPEPKTKGVMYQVLAEYLKKHPEEQGKLEVVPAHEGIGG